MGIICVERVIIAVSDLKTSRENWRRAGFGLAAGEFQQDGIRIARLAAGAVEIDLCACTLDGTESSSALVEPIAAAIVNGGGMIGWVWGTKGPPDVAQRDSRIVSLPGIAAPTVDGMISEMISAEMISSSIPGVTMAAVETRLDIESRRLALARLCGPNTNRVEYLEHIVVMTPVLEDAIAAHESLGVACKRVREVGNGARQAFFKLEQTVLEVVGPARGSAGCWGIALMCSDIAKAVATVRAAGLQATEPKAAIQGGQIARIVAPLDNVAIAFMQAGPRQDT